MRKLLPSTTPILLVLLIALNLHAKPQVFESEEISIVFEGNRVFTTQQLLEITNGCLAKNPQSRDQYDPRVFKFCLSAVSRFMRQQGYLRAAAGEARVEKTESGTKLTVPIEEGARYRLGIVKIEGATVFPPEQLLQMLNLKTGDIANGDAIAVGLYESLKKVYADRGYIQYSPEIEPEFKPVSEGSNEGLVDFTVRIDEGRLFTVSRIEFAGNRQTADQLLRSALVIKENEPYSEQYLHESLKKIDEMGLFEKIDKERDVEFRSNDKRYQLDIVIRVKEKINP